ncbi:MAG: DUF6134 family protein [Methylotetracoccus sp.]
MKLRHCAGSALLMIAGALAASAVSASSETLRFKVSLGDKEIGTQNFRLDRNGERLTVAIDAEFDVRYIALNFYSYRHRNTEIWNGNCLESMQARTDDNGDQLAVEGASTPGGFKVQATNLSTVLPACVMSFAYWNTEFLKATRLLNSQTGVYEPVRVDRVGRERIRVRGQSVDATRYRLTGNKIAIDLWYADDQRWLRLESQVKDSRLIYDLI